MVLRLKHLFGFNYLIAVYYPTDVINDAEEIFKAKLTLLADR